MANGWIQCPRCHYERNSLSAKTCERCGASLHKGQMPILWIVSGLALLGLIGTGALFLRHEQSLSPSPTSPAGTLSDQITAGSGQMISSGTQTYQRYQDVVAVPSGVFNYGGSTTFAPLRSPQITQALAQVFPQFQLRYVEPPLATPGSSTGIRMLLQGQLSFAQSSRGLNDAEIAQAQQRGYVLEAIPIAIDGIALYLNPQSKDWKLDGLTVAQVRDIFTGKLRNWSELGGPSMAIVPISRPATVGGTVDFFNESVLGNQPSSPTVQLVRDTTASIRQVANTPGSIGYASAAEVVNQRSIYLLSLAKQPGQAFVSPCSDNTCSTVNATAFRDSSYPITRRLFVITKKDGSLDEEAGLAYANLLLSNQGQQFIAQAGFVPIR
ncbi:MAG TPA: substrate-binding domain-containing protein [Stenomitos sp.]